MAGEDRHPENLTSRRGFLPPEDPLKRLPAAFEPVESLARDLPKLLLSDHLRSRVGELPPINVHELTGLPERERLMLLLSFIGHAYVWGATPPADRIPASLAVPWHGVSQRLGRPPVLSYASYALNNWRRIDPDGEIQLGNIVLLQNFLGGLDEEWFVMVHVEIEALAGRMLPRLVDMVEAAKQRDVGTLRTCFTDLAASLERILDTLVRMPEHCDPYIYFSRVRPYIHGWKNHPALPHGVLYEDVEAYGSSPQLFRGETGAQSSIIPSLDAALGIRHSEDPLLAYLREMREYMPPPHRRFIESLEQGSAVRKLVLEYKSVLGDGYNECVSLVHRFRERHLEYAGAYIHKQSVQRNTNPADVGTGGTPFMAYLKKHRDETLNHIIR